MSVIAAKDFRSDVATANFAPSLSVRDVTVAYPNGVVALRDASFDLGPGTICGLVGVNGSGKSTELKSLEKTLEEKKLFTIKIDALDTLDLEDPNYIDILFAIASEIERQMREKKMPLPKKLMNSIENWFYEVTAEKTTGKEKKLGWYHNPSHFYSQVFCVRFFYTVS